jgi:hypothetical protein
MANPKQHQEKADHNRSFLNSLGDDGFCDWMAVVAFYVAVHLVEKLRAYEGKHSTDHVDRNAAVRQQHRPIHTPYHELFNWSLIARYKTPGCFSMPAATVRSVLVGNYLTQIEKYVADQTALKTRPAAKRPRP